MEVELSEQIKFIYAVYGYPREDIPVQLPHKRIWDFLKGGTFRRGFKNVDTTENHKIKLEAESAVSTSSGSSCQVFPTFENIHPDELLRLRYFLEIFFWSSRTLQSNYGKNKSSKSCGLSMIASSTQRFINHYNEFVGTMEGKFLIFYGLIFPQVLAIRDIPHLLSIVEEAMKFKLFDKRDKPQIKLFLSLNSAAAAANSNNDLRKSLERTSTRRKYKIIIKDEDGNSSSSSSSFEQEDEKIIKAES